MNDQRWHRPSEATGGRAGGRAAVQGAALAWHLGIFIFIMFIMFIIIIIIIILNIRLAGPTRQDEQMDADRTGAACLTCLGGRRSD